MPKATFVQLDGSARTVEVAEGCSLMEGAVRNNVRGIDADCGGACACATCHVYVDPEWEGRLNRPEETEMAMLDFVVAPATNSRLSCQIKMTAALDGLTVKLPAAQR